MNRSSRNLAVQMTELALAAPQVVNHRMARLALAGPQPSARDRREFHRMGAEKAAAFVESWAAMWMQLWAVHQQLAFAWLNAGVGVMGKGLAPVHRRAVANARRLGGTGRR